MGDDINNKKYKLRANELNWTYTTNPKYNPECALNSDRSNRFGLPGLYYEVRNGKRMDPPGKELHEMDKHRQRTV